MRATDPTALQDAIAGEVLLPGEPGYDAARRPAIANFADTRPRAVVRCRGEDDVAATLAFAADAGVPVAPRSGGHCFAGRSSTGGIVLDVTPMHAVEYADGTVTIGAGARLGDVYDALDPHGVTIPAGCGPDVGIAGLTLGGGLGILGRRDGLTADALRAARVTLPAAARSARRGARARPVLGAARRGRRAGRRRHRAHVRHRPGARADELPPRLAGRGRGGADRRLAGVVAGRRRTRSPRASSSPPPPTRPHPCARTCSAR